MWRDRPPRGCKQSPLQFPAQGEAMTIPASSAPPRRRSPWRLGAIGGLVATVVAGYAAVTMVGASAAETLLSQGKPATASSTQAAGAYLASEAVDGNLGTRWSSAPSDPQWLQVDLGSSQSITRVELNWETAAAKAFQIQVSDNASTWTSIYSTTTSTGGNQSLTVSGTGRYVRMYGTQRTTGYGYSLWEFQVYGTGGSPTPPPPPPPAPNFANLAWSDEFNGPNGSTPDPAKWTPEVGPG